ncbi:copper resistance CopC/CopD family protein [Bosea lathyri]|uniref:Copper transport protein n=1 Tax=Bosea lathyri TaxID=1036778 RepID=A0A1H6AQZ5_9HYPH|nr:CopD family protein [Bosea lathyri]SEG50475.1 copper transport protein [Bosea lathyri]
MAMRGLLALLWLTLASTILVGGQALAHAALVEAHPPDGAIVEQAPKVVRLRFNEPVSAIVTRLTDAQGRSHPGLAVTARNETLDIAVPDDLPRGSHLLSYRVISGDGHPVGGSIVFSIGAATGPVFAPAPEKGAGVHAALWLARMALYLGLFMGAGGVFFTIWIAPRQVPLRAIRVLEGLLGLGVAAAALSVGLQGLDVQGAALVRLIDPCAWIVGWRTSFGLTAATGALALILAWRGLRARREPLRRGCGLAALACSGAALALSGHAGGANPQWLTRPAVFLHGVGVAYWIGALLPLAALVQRFRVRALPTVRRFSNGALVAVAVLTLAGLVLGTVQVEDPANLAGTAYGRVLIVKTALVSGLLGLAALNRLWLTPALANRRRRGSPWLARSIFAEIALAVIILAIAGLWRFTPPPRALAPAAAAATSVSVHLHSAKVMAQVTLSRGHADGMQARLSIATGRGETIEPKEVRLSLARPDAGIEPLQREARRAGSAWLIEGLALPVPGHWQVKVDILVDDFETVRLEGSILLSTSAR